MDKDADKLDSLNKWIKYAQRKIKRAKNDLAFWTKELKSYKKRKNQLLRIK